jgi:hypothetical protein
MSTDHARDAERQARVERMITEFREAHSRRFGKPHDNAVEATSNSNVKTPRGGTPVSPFRFRPGVTVKVG